MAKYSDADLKWITVHPNGKGEKPGVKVAINGGGEVVKGPKGLKDGINASGGLKGAKSVPIEQLKNGGGVDDDVPTFAMPDDFGDLGDDDVPTFTGPEDFGDLSDNGGNKFTDKQIDAFIGGFEDDGGTPEAIKAVMGEHPDWFFLKVPENGTESYIDATENFNIIDFLQAVKAKMQELGGGKSDDWLDDDAVEVITNILADYGHGESDIESFLNALSNGDTNYPNKDKMYKKFVNELGENNALTKKIASALGLAADDNTGVKFSDDEKNQIADALVYSGYTKDSNIIKSFIATLEGKEPVYEINKEFLLSQLEEGLEEGHPLINKIKAALGMPTEGDAGGGQKPQTPTFTDENIDTFAEDFMKSAGLKGLKNKNIIKKFIADNQDKFSVDPATGEVGVASQEAANDLIQHLIDTNPANGGGKNQFTEEQIKKFATNQASSLSYYSQQSYDKFKGIIQDHPEFLQQLSSGELTWASPEAKNSAIALMNGISANPTDHTKPTVINSNWNGDTTGGHKFPASMDEVSGLKFVKNLGGASGAQARLFQDADGNHYVMKRFEPSDTVGQARLKEECDADTYYLAGGATVPHFKLYGDEKSGYVKLSRFIPGTKQLGQVWHNASPEMKEKIKDGLRQHFALDVMAGAWDVLGKDRDNILVDGEGNVYRCDNGGAFNRRAQGDEKSDAQWGNGHIDDLWTMRGLAAGLDGKKSTDGTGKEEFFGDITTHQLLSDIASRDWDTAIAHLPPETKAVMQKRIANAKDYHGMCNNVVVDGKYGDGQHAEDLTLNYHCLNKFGAMEGCKNDNIGPGNWGFCRGNGGGANPKPTLSQFFTKPEPQLSDFTNIPEPMVSNYTKAMDVNQPAQILLTAAKTINHHTASTDKNGNPNANLDGHPTMSAVDAAIALKPTLEAVAVGNDANAQKAKEMLAYVKQIEALKSKSVNGMWPTLTTKLDKSPTGPVDTVTPESKANAQALYEKDHKDWEAKVANAKTLHATAHSTWKNEKAAAEKQLDAAVKAWEQKTGGKGFGFKNLTECFEKFCKDNGIDSQMFWSMAKDQGGESWYKGSCQMKAIELHEMGFSWGQIKNDKCQGAHLAHVPNTFSSAEEFESNPALFEKHRKAYMAMKALTQMLFRNSTFANKIDDGNLFIIRSENKTKVTSHYKMKKDKLNVYPMGSHESFAMEHLVHVHGDQDIGFKIPFSRVSSAYWLLNPSGGDMYCDSEGECGVNAIGIPGYYFSSAQHKVTGNMKEFFANMNQIPIVCKG